MFCVSFESQLIQCAFVFFCAVDPCMKKREAILHQSWAPGGEKGCSLYLLHLSWKGSRGMRYLLFNHHSLEEAVTLAGTKPWIAGALWYSCRHIPSLAELQSPEDYQLLTLSIIPQRCCPYFSDCSKCMLQACMVMVMHRLQKAACLSATWVIRPSPRKAISQ